MVFLFRSGTIRQKLWLIFKATRTHARNLASFAFAYKAMMVLLRHSPRPGITNGSKEASYDTFLAGLVGGYLVFGRGIQSSVNQQIVIYVFARVCLALAKLSVHEGGVIPAALREKASANAWPVFAALSWGSVMWLFRHHADAIQPSLRSSMKYMFVFHRPKRASEMLTAVTVTRIPITGIRYATSSFTINNCAGFKVITITSITMYHIRI
jgi:hypothetical protein